MGEPTQSHTWDTDDVGRHVLAFWEGGQAKKLLPPGGRIVVGRSLECDLTVLHASVSRRHIEIIGVDPPRVKDLGSANGTRLAGRRLARGEEAPIEVGDTIELGSAMILIRAPLEPLRPSAPERDGQHAMSRLKKLVELVAGSHLSVILLGDTGVGKEVTARAIRDKSPRAHKPFVRMNCAALAESLLDSELFGYEKGAFTGAQTAKAGLIEAADGGTLFLDEIGEAPLGVQAKLLRTLELGEVRRVGGVEPRMVDVRIIAATNRDLPALVESGAFRRDLYFRLNGLTLRVPALRERRDEIASLARGFLQEICAGEGRPVPSISRQAIALLEAHPFPGNVRELRNVVASALLLSRGDEIQPEHLLLEPGGPRENTPPPAHDPTLQPNPPSSSEQAHPLRAEIEALERARILGALEQTGGNQTRAAALLGVSRRTLIHRMEQYSVPRPRKA